MSNAIRPSVRCPSVRGGLIAALMMLLLLLGQLVAVNVAGAVEPMVATATELADPVTTPATQCSSNQLLDGQPRSDWCCDCWHSHESADREMQCRCQGLALQRLPQRLPAEMQRLTVDQANLLKLRVAGLQRYAATLKDIMLADVPMFETIESGALSQCRQLRTLYISQAPRFTHLANDIFDNIPDTFRSLRIINCGLQHVPDLTHFSPRLILHMVDLEGNQISQVDEQAVRVRTEQFILDNNRLEYINQSAFMGSQFAKLSLKGNRRLRHVHPKAFAGIVHIQELDLSSTALQVLPTEGLSTLETLRIQNTHTLRTIPSVYEFKNLRFAWLTHPFHCCAFKFPSRHDPQRYKQRQRYLAELRRTCIDNGLPVAGANGSMGNSTGGSGTNEGGVAKDVDESNATDDSDVWSTVVSSAMRWRRSVWSRLVPLDGVRDADDGGGDAEGGGEDLQTFYEGGLMGGFSDDASLNSITGRPLDDGYPSDNAQDAFEFAPPAETAMDFGVFHETAAEIDASSVLRATCGKLSKTDNVLVCYPKPDALNPCEDVMGMRWLRISVWLVVGLAVVGNIAVLVVLISSLEVTVTKFLMSNLAFADLCLGLYLLLIASIDAHSIGEYFNYGYEWQYGYGCQAAGFLTVFASHLSVFTLCIITLERWYAITNAMQLNKRIKMRAAICIMIGGWLYSILMSALPLFGISNYSSTSICLPMEARDKWDVAYLVLIIGNSGLAFCFIAVCYGQIYMSLGKDTRQAHRNASATEMSVAKKMALLVFTNFACWAPIAFFGLTALAGFPFIDVAKSKILLVFFYPLNSCADPYLYAILTAQYRRDLFAMFARCGLCRQRARLYSTNFSMPMLNNQDQRSSIRRSTLDRSGSGSRKTSRDYFYRTGEEFV